MSGELRKPGKSIAKGTVWALEATFVIYVSVLVMMASAVERQTFYKDLGVVQDVRIPRLGVCDESADLHLTDIYRPDTDRSWHAGIDVCQRAARSVCLLQNLASDSQGQSDPRTGCE
jgi:hypothetical protein